MIVRQQVSRFLFLVVVVLGRSRCGIALLMSDLPTPSFVLDMQALQRTVDSTTEQYRIPCLQLQNGMLHPSALDGAPDHTTFDPQASSPLSIDDAHSKEALCYIHSRVMRSREEAQEGQDDPISTFLAEIDLGKVADADASIAQLVLGLNNHHVGSYYWARSAGAGASMEAPGIVCNGGILRWAKLGGPQESNSNDGKRSEWVNFLREGDTVQLLPFHVEEAICNMKDIPIFGVSSKNRPLGSEPQVICEWKLQ